MAPTSPVPPPDWPIPKLHLRVQDLSCDGAVAFFHHVPGSDPGALLRDSILNVFRLLYNDPASCPINVRSVTLVLRSMGGVAHTHGSELDNDHKEIHFSTDYIKGVGPERARSEILGVIQHELVHCFQYDALGSCPGGLIEGIADWVRLRAGHAPAHWKRGSGGKWDDGYEKTGYFLQWVEERYGDGTIRKINAGMRDTTYADDLFVRVTGHQIGHLWDKYQESLNQPT